MSFINVVVVSVYLNLMVRDVFENYHGSEYLQRNEIFNSIGSLAIQKYIPVA